MFKKVKEIEKSYEFLKIKLQDPDCAKDQKAFSEDMKKLSEMGKVVETHNKYEKLLKELNSAKEVLDTEKEEEMRELAREEIPILEKEIQEVEKELKILLIPKDSNDDKNVILEIRAGAGGDEAGLFAQELFSAYNHFANHKKWKFQVLTSSYGNAGGFKEVIASISGEKVYSFLKYESGVHRVQRVPQTETQGRVHTSTITVAVLPEAEDVDVNVQPQELRIDVYRSSGHGGQSVNTTDSAVRVTHLPTGLIVTCQDGKSQHSNKQQALKVLYARLKALEEEKAQKEASEARLSQIGTGDRAEKIRTYNFPQTRVTDHRIGLTLHRLKDIMEGDFTHIIEPLVTHFQLEKLKATE